MSSITQSSLLPGLQPGIAHGLAHAPAAGVSGGHVGHRLLPMWEELLRSLPLLGEACIIARNQHVIMGGMGVYPTVEDRDEADAGHRLHTDLAFWKEGWHYEETVNGHHAPCIEFRDAQGLGFHKVIFTERTDQPLARAMMKAFEQESLTQVEIGQATKANHLDGACCPACEATMEAQSRAHVTGLRQFIQNAISLEKPLQVVLNHAGLVTVRRFLPGRWKAHGLWLSVAGDGVSLFIRSSGIGSLELNQIDFEDIGPSQLAMVRDRHGNLMVSLVMEGHSPA